MTREDAVPGLDGDRLYIRQEPLGLSVPFSAAVVGCGGIGSWVALFLALLGVERLILVDPDVVEIHNLNRTPFKASHVGKTKVEALRELILERRPGADISTYDSALEGLPMDVLEEISQCDVVVEARDSYPPAPAQYHPERVISVGYDGFKASITTRFNADAIIGDRTATYRVIPSFVGTPALIAAMVVTIIATDFDLDAGARVASFDLRDLLGWAFSVETSVRRDGVVDASAKTEPVRV